MELKEVLSRKLPPMEDKKKIKQEKRKADLERFCSLTNKERYNLYLMICKKWYMFQMHMDNYIHEGSSRPLDRKDFAYASEIFKKSYLFDLAIDITSQIERECIEPVDMPLAKNKAIIDEVKLVERRYVD